MGHALGSTIEDILIRWQRMRGYNAMWLPGTDHAGIATQMVVERELKRREGKTRHDLGREEFVERVVGVEGAQRQPHHRAAASCWAARSTGTRERFTMDDAVSTAVREAFVRLYEEGLIYRAQAAHQLVPGVPRPRCRDLEVDTDEDAAASCASSRIRSPTAAARSSSRRRGPRRCSATPRSPCTRTTRATST